NAATNGKRSANFCRMHRVAERWKLLRLDPSANLRTYVELQCSQAVTPPRTLACLLRLNSQQSTNSWANLSTRVSAALRAAASRCVRCCKVSGEKFSSASARDCAE